MAYIYMVLLADIRSDGRMRKEIRTLGDAYRMIHYYTDLDISPGI